MNITDRDRIDLHADDYAISVHASDVILECVEKGKLTSISIIPNLSCFKQCMAMLKERGETIEKKPKISVHLNFMEGHCCSDQKLLPELVDENGYFKISWGSLIKASYYGRNSVLMKNQLKIEIKRQIEIVQASLPWECGLRIDSHQHTHMIPIVWKALMEVIEEEQYKVEFIRVAQEPMLPFLKKIRLYPTYSMVNIVKNIILNLYAAGICRELKRRNMDSALLWGLVMSGHMDIDRIKVLYASMIEAGRRRGKMLEVLFHPGIVLPEEITEEYNKEGFVQFHLSKGRKIEHKAVDEF